MEEKINYNLPLKFKACIKLQVGQLTNGQPMIEEKEFRVSIEWQDIVTIEEYCRGFLWDNPEIPRTNIVTRWSAIGQNGYIALDSYDRVDAAWTEYKKMLSMGLTDNFINN